MPVHNEEIALKFEEIADLLEVEGANPFRVRAYRNAARTIRGLGSELGEMLAEGEDLTELPGIGKDLAGKIQEMLSTGHLKALDQLHKEVPASLEDILHIPGLGPKRVKQLYHELHIKNVKQLQSAARQGRLRELAGFGEKTEQRILESLQTHPVKEKRYLHNVARQYAEPLVKYLKAVPGVKAVIIAGSYRRGKETVGDIDILVTAEKSSKVMHAFVAYDEVQQVVSSGITRATVYLRNGLQVDLRVVRQVSYGAALYYFTGSKSHNIQIRRIAQQKGLKINEYGVFKDEQRIAGQTEASVARAVGLPLIAPELRESRGEIEAARNHSLPTLITYDDLQGDLHVHSDATDGHDTIEKMANAAKQRGLKYIAITDHSQHLTIAHGLNEKRLHQQLEQIDKLNENLKGITILKGSEVDILEDGQLDLPDSILRELDLVVAAVHSKFHLSRSKQTRRILRAMDSRYFTMLAHPSGRLLNEREAYEVDLPRIIKAAAERGCYLEVNSQPQRLDLDDVHCQLAKEQGVMVSINSDAHSVRDFDYLAEGVNQARRGWLEKQDVLNTLSLGKLKKKLKATMG
ncbi:MAG: DNA polymerase/3'-5' exonuclease PolX [Thioalkalispiraceae bacterium]|jgi:DNA polymerase (family 10)